ncbi:hypothetical protein BU16DRAFT_621700 [Lophium mytilinum]|uniref:F-box domain-containing protein n=1 Tax=Lophium mytilinum TaxID=390894 RepID=A0A6A6QFJ2_9PEZI|nr:hypothetical protein BU16DRAFT_621700 [Lophium mytilinum]
MSNSTLEAPASSSTPINTESPTHGVLHCPELLENILSQTKSPHFHLQRYKRVSRFWTATIAASPILQHALWTRRLPRLETQTELTCRRMKSEEQRDGLFDVLIAAACHMEVYQCRTCSRAHDFLSDEHIHPVLQGPFLKGPFSYFAPPKREGSLCWCLAEDGTPQFTYSTSFPLTLKKPPGELAAGSWRDAYALLPPVSRIYVCGEVGYSSGMGEVRAGEGDDGVRVGQVFDEMVRWRRKGAVLKGVAILCVLLAVGGVVWREGWLGVGLRFERALGRRLGGLVLGFV